jgi:hypothetical protein
LQGAFADFLIQHIATGDSGGEDNGVKSILKDLESVIGSKEEILARKSCPTQTGTEAGAGDTEQVSSLFWNNRK